MEEKCVIKTNVPPCFPGLSANLLEAGWHRGGWEGRGSFLREPTMRLTCASRLASSRHPGGGGSGHLNHPGKLRLLKWARKSFLVLSGMASTRCYSGSAEFRAKGDSKYSFRPSGPRSCLAKLSLQIRATPTAPHLHTCIRIPCLPLLERVLWSRTAWAGQHHVDGTVPLRRDSTAWMAQYC